MTLIQIRRPSPRDLRLFGLVVALFFGLVGGLVWWKSGALGIPTALWAVGVLVSVVYYAAPRWRPVVYYGWMKLAYPIGWLVSHVLLLVAYFLVITPIGLIMRAFGRDEMRRTFDRDAPTYWDEHNPAGDKARYFRQF